MEKIVKQAFFDLINWQVFENKPVENLTEEVAKECALIANRYDLLPIISNAILQTEITLSQNVKNKLTKEQLFSLVRCEQILHDIQVVRNAFNDAKIEFIMLKGAFIRTLYNKPQFRTSCDIDVLVKENQIKKATIALIKAGFIKKPKEMYVYKFESTSGVGLDLHYSLKGSYNQKISNTLDLVWDNAELKVSEGCEYQLTPEFFMFYFLAHMQKHFKKGCGIKPFIDLKILTEKLDCNKEELNQIIKDNGLFEFYSAMLQLNQVWFNNAKHSELSLLIEEFIFDGGTYGSIVNDVAVKKSKANGKSGFIRQRLFLDFDQLSGFYPNLVKHKWLMPFYQVKRWFKVFRKGKMKKSAIELSVAKTVDEQKIQKTKIMLEKLNLND